MLSSSNLAPHQARISRSASQLTVCSHSFPSAPVTSVVDPAQTASPPVAVQQSVIFTSDYSNRTDDESPRDPIDFVAYGGRIYANGEPFDIKGINWFGSESRHGPPSGLARHGLGFYLDLLEFHGFNALRLLFNHQSVLRNSRIEENE